MPQAAVAPFTVTPKAGQSTSDAWDESFSSQKSEAATAEFQAGLRSTVRAHLRNKEFAEIQVIIGSALRKGYGQPWMYEALALALEADGASENEIARVVLSALDVSRDTDSALITGDYLASLRLDRTALRVFQDVATQDPFRSEAYLQGLKCAQRLKDSKGIQWACVGVLKQAWATEQRDIETFARRVAEATISDLHKEGKKQDAEAFDAAVKKALSRDIRVKVWWTGDADIDMSVMEPTGDICSFRNPCTSGGGMILGDSFARNDKIAPREGFCETFICTEGFSGEYKVFLKRIWGEVTAGKINVEVITHDGTAQRTIDVQKLELGKDGVIAAFNLFNGRRAESLSTEKATISTKRQIEVARHVLAQQIPSSASGSGSSGETWKNANVQFIQGPLAQQGAPAFRGAVGFRPQLSILQDGPQLTAGPAVVSADRRFVRMTLSPIFRTIGEVQTFNFASGSVGNGNGTGNTPNPGGAGGAGSGGGGGGGGVGGGGAVGT